MNRKIFKGILFSSILAMSGLVYSSCEDYDDDIYTINERLEGFEADVNDLRTQLERVKGSIPSLETVNNKIGQLVTDYNKLKDDLGGRIDGVEGSLGDRIDEVEGSLGDRIDGVEGDLGGLGDRIDGVESGLGDRIDGLEGSLNDRIDGLETSLADRIKGVESILGERISELTGSLMKQISDNHNVLTRQIQDLKSYADNSLSASTAATIEREAEIKRTLSQLNADLKSLQKELNNQVVNAAGQMTDLANQQRQQGEKLNVLVTEINDLKILLPNVEMDVAVLKELKERVLALETQILELAKVQTEVANLEDQLKDQQQQLSDCRAEIAALKLTDVQHTERLTVLKEKADKLERDMEKQQESIAAGQTRIDNLTDDLNRRTEGLGRQLLEAQKSINANITNLKNDFNAHKDEASAAFAEKVGSLQVQIDSLFKRPGADLAPLTEKVAALEQQLADHRLMVEGLPTLQEINTGIADSIRTIVNTAYVSELLNEKFLEFITMAELDNRLAKMDTTISAAMEAARLSTEAALKAAADDNAAIREEHKADIATLTAAQKELEAQQQANIKNISNLQAADQDFRERLVKISEQLAAAVDVQERLKAMLGETQGEVKKTQEDLNKTQGDLEQTKNELTDKLGQVSTALNEASSALNERCEGIESGLNDIKDEVARITDDIDDINGRIQGLDDRVSALEKRIQSLVWVPGSFEEATKNVITLNRGLEIELDVVDPSFQITDQNTKSMYFTLDGNTTQGLELKFRVTPASLAEKIAEEAELAILVEEVPLTRGAEPVSFRIDSREGDSETGIIKLQVSTDNTFSNATTEDKKYPLLALQVKLGNGQQPAAEFVTNYIPTLAENEELTMRNCTAFLSTAATAEKAEALKINGNLYKTTMQVSDTEHRFMEGVKPYLDYKGKILDLSGIFGDILTCSFVPNYEQIPYPSQVAEFSTHEDLMGFDMQNPEAGLEGQEINTVFYCIFKDKAGNNYSFKNIFEPQENLTFVATNTDVTHSEDITLKYDATRSVTWEVDLKDAISVKDYLKLKEDFKKVTNIDEPVITPNGAIERVNGKITGLKAEFKSDPLKEGDEKIVAYTLSAGASERQVGQWYTGADYRIQNVFDLESGRTLTVKQDIKLKGLPGEIATSLDLTVPYTGNRTLTDLFQGENQSVTAHLLQDQNIKALFTSDKLEEILEVQGLSLNNIPFDLEIIDDKLSLTNLREIEFGKPYEVVLSKEIKIGSVDLISILIIRFNITFTNSFRLVADGHYIKEEGGVSRASVSTKLNGDKFDIALPEFNDLYNISSGDENIQPTADLEIVYSLNKGNMAQNDKLNTMDPDKRPEVSGTVDNPKLEWNGWEYNELELRAELKDKNSGTILDTKTFRAVVPDPLQQFSIDPDAKDRISTTEEYDLTKALTLNIKGTQNQDTLNVFDPTEKGGDGLDNDVTKAVNGKLTVTYPEDIKFLDETKLKEGIIKVKNESFIVTEETTVTFKVRYECRYSSREIDIDITFVPNTND